MIDTAALIAFLREGEKRNNPVVGAIYEGLRQRIERGDFEVQGEEQ